MRCSSTVSVLCVPVPTQANIVEGDVQELESEFEHFYGGVRNWCQIM